MYYHEDSYITTLSDEPAPKLANTKALALLAAVTILERFSFYTVTLNLQYALDMFYNTSHPSLNPNNTRSRIDKYIACDTKTKKTDLFREGHLNTLSNLTLVIGLYALIAVMSIFGGWLGDGRIGKYRAIKFSFIFYFLGVTCFGLLVRFDDYQPVTLTFFYIFFSIGYGLFKPNIAPFFSDQMVDTDKRSVQRMLHGIYFCINLGTVFAAAITFAQVRYYEFTIFSCLLTYLVCFILFCCGSNYLHKEEPSNDAFRTVYLIVKEMTSLDSAVLQAFRGSRLEALKDTNGGLFRYEEINSFKTLSKVIPGLFLLLGFYVPYSNLYSLFFTQAYYLQHPDSVPISITTCFDPIVVVIMVPLMNVVIYPYLEKRRKKPDYLDKVMFGICFCGLSMICAGFVAVATKHGTLAQNNPDQHKYHYHHHFGGKEVTDERVTYRARINISVLLVQTLLISVGEVFAIIGGMEYAYLESPPSMKCVVMGVMYMVNAIGNILSILLLFLTAVIFDDVVCNELTSGRISYFFYLNAGWGLMFMIYILFLRYKERRN